MRRWLAVGAGACALAVAGCGDDDEETTGGGGGGGEAATTQAAEGGGNAGLQEFEAKIEDDVAAAKGPDPAKPPTTGPQAAPDKTVWVVSCALVAEGCKRVSSGMMEAAEAAGWQAKLVDTKSDPTRISTSIQQAIAAKVDGILTVAIDGNQISGPLKRAKDAGIPVVSAQSSDPNKEYTNAIPENDAFVQQGYTMGQASYQLAKGKLQMIMFTGQEFGSVRGFTEGTEKFIEDCKAAGGDCEIVTKENVPIQNLATSAAGSAVSTVRKNPDANLIWTGYDPMALTFTPGFKRAGIDTPVVSFNGDSPNVKAIKEGGQQKATMGGAYDWIGWHAIDNLNRVLSGEEPVPYPGSSRLYMQDNAPDDPSKYLGHQEFAADYKRLWGVG